MPNNPAVRNLLVTIGVLVVLGSGVYVFLHRAGANIPSTTASTTSQTLPNGTVIRGLPPGATVTETDTVITVPDYKKPIVVSQPLDAHAQSILQAQFEVTKTRLAANPKDFDSWIRLGTLRKIAGDYKGAAEDWEYVSEIFSDNVVSHGNLGDLYLYFIKDYAKAELNYRQAIAINPKVIDYYRALFFLYRDISKDKTKAQAILTQGLKANPNNSDLIALEGQIDDKP